MSTANPFCLEGKTILVTGASSGIGRACATVASQMGARLLLTGRDAARLQNTLTALDGNGHMAHVMDLNDAAALPAWVQRLDPIDGLVYAAGVARVAPFRMMSEQQIQLQMDINFKAPMLLTQALLKVKKINPKASLVYLTAVADRTAPVGSATYAASKAALITAVQLHLAWLRQDAHVRPDEGNRFSGGLGEVGASGSYRTRGGGPQRRLPTLRCRSMGDAQQLGGRRWSDYSDALMRQT